MNIASNIKTVSHRLRSILVVLILVTIVTPVTQGQKKQRLNRFVESLESGKVIFGAYAQAKTPDGARLAAKTDMDVLFYDLEHDAMDVSVMSAFMTALKDSGSVFERFLMVRIPAVHENVAAAQKNTKDVLDAGTLSIMFPTVGTRAEAETAVKAMRYTTKGGTRSPGAGKAAAYWGISEQEYINRADLWPLNPNGELASLMLVESLDGLKNVKEIAGTTGLTVLLPGPGSLTQVLNGDMVKHEAAIQSILAACKEKRVPCGIASQPETVEKRIREGFQLIFANGPRAAETIAIGRKVAASRKQ